MNQHQNIDYNHPYNIFSLLKPAFKKKKVLFLV